MRVVIYCLLGGLALTAPALGNGGFGSWWLAGIVLSASFVPVPLFGPRRVLSRFGVIAPVLLIVTVLCLWSEAIIFVQVPGTQQDAVRSLVGASVIYIIVAAAGAAAQDWQLVAHQLAATAGEDRRPIDQARPVLLAAAG